METVTKKFKREVAEFCERTRMSPTELGERAIGDRNFCGDLRRGRSPTLATADRVWAVMADYDRAHPESVSADSHPPGDVSFRGKRDRAVTRATEQEMRTSTHILGLPEVQARTGLTRNAIHLRVADGSFAEPVCVVGWVQEDVDAWIRSEPAASRPDAP